MATIVLSDDRSESSMGLVIDKVEDIVEGVLELTASTQRPGTLGSMILKDRTVDVIDIAYFLGLAKGNWFSMQTHAGIPYVPYHLAQATHQDFHPANQSAQREDKHTPQEAPSSAPARHPLPLNGGYISRRPSVLVVDDSVFFRNMLKPILTSAGYDVTLSEDALQAIKYHDEGRLFDVILSDIEMPGMDGYEFVEKMRGESQWKDIPFIAITSHNTPADIEYGYKKGFDQYIGKFDKNELIDTLAKVHSSV